MKIETVIKLTIQDKELVLTKDEANQLPPPKGRGL